MNNDRANMIFIQLNVGVYPQMKAEVSIKKNYSPFF